MSDSVSEDAELAPTASAVIKAMAELAVGKLLPKEGRPIVVLSAAAWADMSEGDTRSGHLGAWFGCDFYVIPSDSAGMVIVAESGHSVPLVTPE